MNHTRGYLFSIEKSWDMRGSLTWNVEKGWPTSFSYSIKVVDNLCSSDIQVQCALSLKAGKCTTKTGCPQINNFSSVSPWFDVHSGDGEIWYHLILLGHILLSRDWGIKQSSWLSTMNLWWISSSCCWNFDMPLDQGGVSLKNHSDSIWNWLH